MQGRMAFIFSSRSSTSSSKSKNVVAAPRIADVLIDRFGMCGRGEIELAEKDPWVSVAAKRAKVSMEST
jgi:hypothetical protein